MLTNHSHMGRMVIIPVLLSLVLSLTLWSQEKTKEAKQVTASLSLLCVGGCNDRDEKASMEDGAFCCNGHTAKVEKALKAVDGVVSVAIKKDSRKVTVEYAPGKLNLSRLIKAADKVGFDIIL